MLQKKPVLAQNPAQGSVCSVEARCGEIGGVGDSLGLCGELVEPNLSKEEKTFFFLLEKISYHCQAVLLLSGVGNAGGSSLQVISDDLINGRDYTITLKFFGLGVGPKQIV